MEARGHVLHENQEKYRRLTRIAQLYNSLGNTIGVSSTEDSDYLWRKSGEYRQQAINLRTIIRKNDLNVEEPVNGQD